MGARNIRFSIDTGGTFTDIVVLDEDSGAFWIDKALTTPEDVLQGMLSAIKKARVNLREVGRFFVYGSTTALNALLERKGVRTAYLTTFGFRDMPQIGRVNRPELYNPKYQKPQPIVPRHLRFEVTERIDAAGKVLTELDEAQLGRVADEIAATGVRALAICFLHAYRNSIHEHRAKEILQQRLPGVSITLSSVVAPEQREYERATTAILNAYLSPIVEGALSTLESTFRANGFEGAIILTKSDGGGMSAEAAKVRAINTLLSGPAGGVIGAQYIAEVTGHHNLVTADLGGTSFDVGIIKESKASVNQQMDAGGLPILMPNLDIRTVGIGGGSIARLDAAGALHVGPQSAGAKPGPICYGRGGIEPTVTDAALTSGYINPGNFLGGEMSLDVAGAQRAIAEKIAAGARLDPLAASTGILRVALSHMMGAITDILSESGDDPRDFTLLSYGGGGPLFAAALVDELNLPAAIVPVAPGNFSAWGMLMIDLRHDFVKAYDRSLKALDVADLRTHFNQLALDAQAMLEREGIEPDKRKLFFNIDVRYVGQGHTVLVAVDLSMSDEALLAAIPEAFHAAYRKGYGYALELPAEVVSLRVKSIGEIAKPKLAELAEGGPSAEAFIKTSRVVTDMIDGESSEHVVYDRNRLLAGNRIAGPALIEEATSVTPVRRNQHCTVDRLGNLIITRSR